MIIKPSTVIQRELNQPVNVFTHSNSWKSHSLMDMSAEHEAEMIIKIKITF